MGLTFSSLPYSENLFLKINMGQGLASHFLLEIIFTYNL